MDKQSLVRSTLQWLYPGLKIKRWLFMAVGGLSAALLGFTLLVGPDLLYLSGRAVVPLLAYLQRPLLSGLILAAGLFLLGLGLQRAASAVKDALSPDKSRSLIDVLYTKCYLEKGPRIVTIGGGTGLSNLLRELKEHTSNLTAVVTVTDDGGSSGRLRGELGILPPGDIRACLLAMADTEPLMEKLFHHRFAGGTGLEGHSFGNLFIAAMTEMFGFQEAVKFFGQILAIRGQVYPVTLDMVQLEAEDAAGRCTRGQSILYNQEGPLKRISLVPAAVKPLPEVLAAIGDADAVVLGPGSLYTSVIPNLLVPGIVEALRHSRAPVFYVCNLMTQPGETTGYTAAEHVRALLDHTSPDLLDVVIVNSDLVVSRHKLEPFLNKGSTLVRPDYQQLQQLVPHIISGPLLNRGFITRHQGPRLAQMIVEQTLAGMEHREGRPRDSRFSRLADRFRRRLGGRINRAGRYGTYRVTRGKDKV